MKRPSSTGCVNTAFAKRLIMRKPITDYVGGKGPRQRIWEAIRTLNTSEHTQNWTQKNIWNALPRAIREETPMVVIRDYRRALVAGGIVEVIRQHRHSAPQKEGIYRLAKDEGIDAPRLKIDGTRVTKGLAQEQMWRTLRLSKGDTNARELAAYASTSAIPIPEGTARSYLHLLHTAGYLIRATPEKRTGLARYRLNPGRNTGPRPPIQCSTKVVYDPNEARVVWAAPISDEDAIYG
jgi:hypothetical protein